MSVGAARTVPALARRVVVRRVVSIFLLLIWSSWLSFLVEMLL